MNINILEIILLIILIVSCIYGWKKGFLRVFFSLVAWIVAIVLVLLINPVVTNGIENYTQIDDRIYTHVEEYFQENGLDIFRNKNSEEMQEKGFDMPKTALDYITDGAVESVDDVVDEVLEASGMYQLIAKSVTHFIVQGIAFVITLFLVVIIIFIIDNLLGLVNFLPSLGGINKYLGIFAGALSALVGTWIFFYIISLFCTNIIGQYFLLLIRGSEVLSYLYDYNLILILITALL